MAKGFNGIFFIINLVYFIFISSVTGYARDIKIELKNIENSINNLEETAVANKDVPYILEEINMVVEVPKENSTLVRNMSEDDLNLIGLYAKPKEITKYFIKENMYLDSLNNSGSIGLNIYGYADKESAEVLNLCKSSNDRLKALTDKFIIEKAEDGFYIDESNIKIEEIGKYKFIVFSSEKDEYNFISMYYYTIYNGMHFEFVLTQDNGMFTNEGKAAIESLINSIRFTKNLTRQEAVEFIKSNNSLKVLQIIKNPKIIIITIVSIEVLFSLIVFINRKRIERKNSNKIQ